MMFTLGVVATVVFKVISKRDPSTWSSVVSSKVADVWHRVPSITLKKA